MSSGGAPRRSAGELEGEVLAVLWAADGALVPAAVQQALGAGLAYTTVQTILARLVAKGAVAREPAGRAHAYRPVLDEAGLAARRMRALLDEGGDRETVLRRFVDQLTGTDERLLDAVLHEHRGGRCGSGAGRPEG